MKISINSNKPPVATIGLPAPGMRLALGFLAENSGSFLLILILEIINDEVFTNDDDDIDEVDDRVYFLPGICFVIMPAMWDTEADFLGKTGGGVGPGTNI